MQPFKTKDNKDYLAVYYDFPIGEFKHTKVTLSYSLGGINYFTGDHNRRGIYLAVTPVTVSGDGVFSSESSVMFSGLKMLVKELKRFSKKELESLRNLMEFDNPQLQNLIETVQHQGKPDLSKLLS